MSKRSRDQPGEAAVLVTPSSPDPRRALPEGQRMARVNVQPNQWAEFRQASSASGRSVADYLGHLVEKELRRVRRRKWRSAASAPLQRPEVVTGAADTQDEVM